MAVDLHPDIVRAINEFAQTKLGKRFGQYARKTYGIGGKKLLAKQTAGEFGGSSTKTGRGKVSTAGARGPGQFIPSTRQAFIQKYGIDPWNSDAEAIKGMALHDLSSGVAGYNPGMPSYTSYTLGQKINPADIAALRRGGGGSGASGSRDPRVTRRQHTVPGVSHASERTDARRQLLLGGDINLKSLLAYKQQIAGLKDEPSKTVSDGLKVDYPRGRRTKPNSKGGAAAPHGKYANGKILEAFYDPADVYYDSGKLVKGAIGGHGDHVHVSADRGYIVQLGKLAQSMGLNVSGQRRFGGTPTSGHTEGSFHYEDEAIDVSGDPKKMAAFYRRVLRAAKAQR